MADVYFFTRDQLRMGPYSAVEMKGLAASGSLLSTDTVWRDGTVRGLSAGKIRNLFPSTLAAIVSETGTLSPSAVSEASPVFIATELLSEPQLRPLEGETPPSAPAVEAAAKTEPAVADKPPTSGGFQARARKGRATAGLGAVIVSQDGERVKFKKKCTTCNHLESSWTTIPIRSGTSRSSFFCPKCRKSREVIVHGSMH